MNGRKQVFKTDLSHFFVSYANYSITGLVNGALGTVVGIVYAPGTAPPGLPHNVLVQFDNYLGTFGSH